MRFVVPARIALSFAIILAPVIFGMAQSPKAPASAALDAENTATARKRYALLIGCTKYNAKLAKTLEGPENDVTLVCEMLTNHFGFLSEDCVTLSEAAAVSHGDKGANFRPMRANIKREFDALTKNCRSGDQVFILLGGHGARQPDHEPFDEPDGFDEVFLPCDAEPYDEDKELFPNAIVDDELHEWVGALSKTGASVCIAVDACHSGTMLRGEPDEVVREVRLSDFTSRASIEAAIKRARDRKFASHREAGEEQSPLALQNISGRVVGIYACRNDECEIETPLPTLGDGQQVRVYGLLTYTLCEVLIPKRQGTTKPLTYRELVQRIQQRYVTIGRTSAPTPLVEGPDADREVFGHKEWPARSRLTLHAVDNEWRLSGGRLHGLTTGSILKVFPEVGATKDDQVIGYVRTTAVGLTESIVEPCEYDKLPPPKNLPKHGRCELALSDFGDLRLKVAAQVTDKPDPSGRAPGLAKMEAVLMSLAAGKSPLPLRVVATNKRPDWRLYRDGPDLFLEAAGGIQLGEKKRGQDIDELPFRLVADRWEVSLADRLGTIARAEMLLRVARASMDAEETHDTSAIDLDLSILKYASLQDKNPEIVPYSQGMQLYADDIVAFKIHNKSQVAVVYPTLLFVDAQYIINAVYPGEGEIAKPLGPGENFITGRLKVNSKTTGKENLLVIAVKARNPKGEILDPTDFTWLAARNLASARGVAVSRGAEDELNSPLGKLFENGLFAEKHAVRGFDRVTAGDSAIRLLSWQTNGSGRATPKK